MKNFGLVNVAAVSPKTIEIGNPAFNANNIIELTKKVISEKSNTNIIVFPELALTGYTCGDLFLHTTLIDSALNELKTIVEYFKENKKKTISVL